MILFVWVTRSNIQVAIGFLAFQFLLFFSKEPKKKNEGESIVLNSANVNVLTKNSAGFGTLLFQLIVNFAI